MEITSFPAQQTYLVIEQLLVQSGRGTMALKSPNPLDDPLVTYNLFRNKTDGLRMVQGFRTIRQISAERGLTELTPGALVPMNATDDQIVAYIESVATPEYHAIGTAKMGVDAESVVDPRGRVYGVKGLRIADLSIFPFPLRAHSAASTAIIIGERISDFILEDINIEEGICPTVERESGSTPLVYDQAAS